MPVAAWLTDWFVLSADYMGDTYTEDDDFIYRGRDIMSPDITPASVRVRLEMEKRSIS